MTEVQFREIKDKIEKYKEHSAEAKAKMSVIESQWQSAYGFSDIESAKKKLEEMKADAEQKKQKKDGLMKKLEESFDWNRAY